MNEVILEYLSQTYTPEYIDSLCLVSDNLVKMDVNTHIDAISLIEPLAHNYEAMDLSNEISSYIRGSAINTLDTLGILVPDDIPNTYLAALVDFVGTFESSDDDETILGIIETETDDKEVLINILNLRTPYTTHEWFEYVDGLKPEQLTNLHELVSGWINETEASDLEPIVDTDMDHQSLVEEYIDRDDTDTTQELSNAGVPLGVSLESLLNISTERIESLPSLEDQVTALIGIHIYSGESYDTLYPEVMESVRGYVIDDGLDVEMRVKHIVDNKINGMKW